MKQVSPIFIVGAPRSGTSLTTWILGQHPNIQPMPETAWIAGASVDAYRAWEKGSERGKFSHLSNVEYPVEPFMERMGEGVHNIVCDVFEARCSRAYGRWREKGEVKWNPKNPNAAMQLRRHFDDPKQRWVDGTPMNTPYLWGLALLFPRAKFIHLVRRPEDVAASLMNFEAVGARSLKAKAAVKTWIDHTHYALLGQRALGNGRVHTVRYEELISDPKSCLIKLFSFLGEEFHLDCLLPLGTRINFSQIEDRRHTIIEKVKFVHIFEKASDLYEQVLLSADDEGVSSEEATRELKQFFFEQVRTR